MDEIVSSNLYINNNKIQGSFKNNINTNNSLTKIKEISATSHLLQNNINQSMDEILSSFSKSQYKKQSIL